MIKVKGIYEEMCIQLLEPVALRPHTPVEVLLVEIPLEYRQEQAFLARLEEKKLLLPLSLEPAQREREAISFEPVVIQGPPLSQTIIAERR